MDFAKALRISRLCCCCAWIVVVSCALAEANWLKLVISCSEKEVWLDDSEVDSVGWVVG